MESLAIDDRRYTLEEWQQLEVRTGEKHEFHEGRLYSISELSGGTARHAFVGANVIGALGSEVRKREPATINCGVYSSVLLIMVERHRRYLYADATIICGKPVEDTVVVEAIENPLVVVEVVSKRSNGYELGEKFHHYTKIASLRDYVIVAEDRPWVEVRSRESGRKRWALAAYERLDEGALIPALGIELGLEEVYRGVEFEPYAAWP